MKTKILEVAVACCRCGKTVFLQRNAEDEEFCSDCHYLVHLEYQRDQLQLQLEQLQQQIKESKEAISAISSDQRDYFFAYLNEKGGISAGVVAIPIGEEIANLLTTCLPSGLLIPLDNVEVVRVNPLDLFHQSTKTP